MNATVPYPDIQTARLRLRPITTQDHEALCALWRNADVRRYLWDNVLVSDSQVRAVQVASDACFARWGCGIYALTMTEAPAYIAGFCGVRDFESTGVPELLYGIHPDYWGMGLVSEAAQALLGFAFDRCALPRLVAATDTPNQSSVKVLQRLGMAFEERKLWHGLDTVFYSLERKDFSGS